MTQTVLRVLGVFLLVLFGLSILDEFDVIRFRNPLTSWMYHWGPNEGAWVARIATGALGAALLFLTPRADD